jgi:hypothetical protein
MGKFVLISLFLLGITSGVGLGKFIKKPTDSSMDTLTCQTDTIQRKNVEIADVPPLDREYVTLNNQFIIPVVKENIVHALVMLSLSLEVNAEQTQLVYEHEPKLRDVLLQTLFDHANIGGFDGTFTHTQKLDDLRQALLEVTQKNLGAEIFDVLITDIARQDK